MKFKSKLPVCNTEHQLRSSILSCRHFPDQRNAEIEHVYSSFDCEHVTSYGLSALYCANMISIRDQARSAGFPVKAVSYHELVSDPGPAMAKVAAFCGIAESPSDGIEEMKLPDADTQKKSQVLSRNNLMKYKNEVRPQEAANLDKVLAASGLPVSAKFPMEAEGLAKVLGWETG